jgi:large subunit ribosomal protein L24
MKESKETRKPRKVSIKIGDRIKVIAGREKGKIGNISSINKKKFLVTVDSIEKRKKFIKEERNERKEIAKKVVEIPIFIHISNVMLWDEKANFASKIGYKYENLKKKRFFKKSGNFV